MKLSQAQRWALDAAVDMRATYWVRRNTADSLMRLGLAFEKRNADDEVQLYATSAGIRLADALYASETAVSGRGDES